VFNLEKVLFTTWSTSNGPGYAIAGRPTAFVNPVRGLEEGALDDAVFHHTYKVLAVPQHWIPVKTFNNPRHFNHFMGTFAIVRSPQTRYIVRGRKGSFIKG
jgi:hypothetical protein